MNDIFFKIQFISCQYDCLNRYGPTTYQLRDVKDSDTPDELIERLKKKYPLPADFDDRFRGIITKTHTKEEKLITLYTSLASQDIGKEATLYIRIKGVICPECIIAYKRNGTICEHDEFRQQCKECKRCSHGNVAYECNESICFRRPPGGL